MLIKSTLLLVIILSGVVASNYPLSGGQPKTQPAWNSIITTRVKPDKVPEFEQYLKRLIEAYKQSRTAWFLTFETFAGDMPEYTLVSPLVKFQDLDAPSPVTTMLGETAGKLLMRQLASCYLWQTREFATPQPDLEIGSGTGSSESYWVETNTLVAPDKMNDYLDWLRNDYRPALEKAGVKRFQVSRPIFGAPTGEVVTMRALKNLAEIDAGTILSRALSDHEIREIAAKSVSLVTSSSTKIVHMRSDLSYAEHP